jgi:hypothetical protein
MVRREPMEEHGRAFSLAGGPSWLQSLTTRGCWDPKTTPKRVGVQRSGNKVIGEKLILRLLILLPQSVCVDLPKT